MHACMHILTRIYIYIYIYVYTRVRRYIGHRHVYFCIHLSTHTHIYICMYKYVDAHVLTRLYTTHNAITELGVSDVAFSSMLVVQATVPTQNCLCKRVAEHRTLSSS